MSQPIENYIPQDFTRRFRQQAWKVWAISGFVVFRDFAGAGCESERF
jgi:hypothetical protein